MKYILLAITLGITPIHSWAYMSRDTDTIKYPNYAYELKTQDDRVAVYEFVPRSDKTKICVVVINYTGNHIPAMQCFTRKGRADTRH